MQGMETVHLNEVSVTTDKIENTTKSSPKTKGKN